jgi:hypothetical protein
VSHLAPILASKAKTIIVKFGLSHEGSKWVKHPFHLDYGDGEYRQKDLARIIRDAVPQFALTKDELKRFLEKEDIGQAQRIAWSRISKAPKNKKGDYGELLLFVLLCLFFDSPKFVTKVRLRSSQKEQIKGFDCAHFTIEEGKIYLWLGEAKFHQSISGAIDEAISSIEEHCGKEYLTNELSILESQVEVNEDFPEIRSTFDCQF